MKNHLKYNVKLLTQEGIKQIVISEGQDLRKLQDEIKNKYGTFITISSTQII